MQSEGKGVEELAALLGRLCPQDGSHATPIDGLYLTRSSSVEVPRQALDRAVLCVVAQGKKSIWLGGERHVYDPSRYLLVSLDLPLTGQVEEASRAKPMLCWSLVLDFKEIASLLEEMGPQWRARPADGVGLLVEPMEAALLDAVVRLTRLVEQAAMAAVLGPLVRREIYYRLLLGAHGGLLQRMASQNGKAQRLAAGLQWLKRNALRPIRMEELARELHMSPSAMHSWFRGVTGMSPLQFQKQLRLQEARRLMLAEKLDAGDAGRQVGYRSASQFSREYGRFFGAPPRRDMSLAAVARSSEGGAALRDDGR